MNKIILLPPGFEPPTIVRRDTYVLEVLAPQHNDIDYAAWNSSIDALQGIFGPSNPWPEANFSKLQNLQDLEQHYQEFEDKVAFAYTILSVDQSLCIGCLYIRPTSAVDYDARVDFWFRNSHTTMAPAFFEALKIWLADEWQFNAVAFPGRDISWQDYEKSVARGVG
jgi:hypothetical protein